MIRKSFLAEHLHRVSRHVGAWRIDHFAEVTKGNFSCERLGVVCVEGGPSAVLRLHAKGPPYPSSHRRLDHSGIVVLDSTQGQDHFGGVIDIRVIDVRELERPGPGFEAWSANGPVALLSDLVVQEPISRLAQRRIAAG